MSQFVDKKDKGHKKDYSMKPPNKILAMQKLSTCKKFDRTKHYAIDESIHPPNP
jgi:hypothetical protein